MGTAVGSSVGDDVLVGISVAVGLEPSMIMASGKLVAVSVGRTAVGVALAKTATSSGELVKAATAVSPWLLLERSSSPINTIFNKTDTIRPVRYCVS